MEMFVSMQQTSSQVRLKIHIKLHNLTFIADLFCCLQDSQASATNDISAVQESARSFQVTHIITICLLRLVLNILCFVGQEQISEQMSRMMATLLCPQMQRLSELICRHHQNIEKATQIHTEQVGEIGDTYL